MVSGIAEAELVFGLWKQDEIVVLHAAACVAEMTALGDGQPGIIVIVQTPQHVVAVHLVLLDAEAGRFIGIVSQALRVEQDLVEKPSMAVLRVDGKGAAEQADAVAEIFVAAVLAAVAGYVGKAVA